MTTENKGNGALDQPIGLITADEMVAAGSNYNLINSNYYLYKGYGHLLFSPSELQDTTTASVLVVSDAGSLSAVSVITPYRIAPVINLSAETAAQLTGSGTMSSPYELG